MITLPIKATDEEILQVVRSFVNRLAEEKYDEALSMVDPNEGYSNWTPELIKRVVLNYGSPDARRDGKTFKVTLIDRAPARPMHAHQEVERLDAPPPNDPNLTGHVLFDLPLNGEWSDLTASFDLVRHREGLALRLDDIHVL